MTKSEVSRDLFLKPVEVSIEEVPAPELGAGAVLYVRGMTAQQRTKFEKQFQTSRGKTHDRRMQEARERLVVATLSNSKGDLLLKEDDLSAVGSQPAPLIERIVNVAQRLIGMTDSDIDSMVKNSEET